MTEFMCINYSFTVLPEKSCDQSHVTRVTLIIVVYM